MPSIPDSVGEWARPNPQRGVQGYDSQAPFNVNLGPARAGIDDYSRSVQGVADAQAGIGEAAGKGIKAFSDMEDRKAATDATTRSNGFQADMQHYLYNPENGILTTKLGQHANGISEKAKEDMTALRDKYAQGVTNPLAIKALNEDFGRMINSGNELVMRHEAQQHLVVAEDALKATVDNQRNAVALNPYDDKGFADAVAKSSTAVGHSANFYGKDSAEAIRNNSSDMWTTRIKTALTSNDPASIVKAGQWYKQAKASGSLNYQDDDALGALLKSVVPKNEALAFHQQTRNQDLTKYVSPDTLYRAGQAGPPGEWAKAIAPSVARQESGGKETGGRGSVMGPNQVTTSAKGAQGDMQVMPTTGAQPGFGVMPVRDDSAAERDRFSIDYLSAMKDRYGDNQLALAAYNAGPGKVDDAIEKAGSKDPAKVLAQLPAETQNYVPKVLGYAAQNQTVNGQGIDQATIEANAAKLPADQRVHYVAAATQDNQQTMQAYNQARLSAIDALQAELATAGGNINSVRPETLAAAHKYGVADALIAGRGESDDALVNQIKAMDTEQLSALDLTDPNIRMRLSSEEIAKWQKEQADMAQNPANVMMSRRVDSAVNYVFQSRLAAEIKGKSLVAAGDATAKTGEVDLELQNKVLRFKDLVRAQIQDEYKRSNGKVPSEPDVFKIADSIVTNEVSVPGRGWFGAAAKVSPADVTLADIHEPQRSIIEKARIARKLPVTEAGIIADYLMVLKQRQKNGGT